jgi:protein phosphatase
MVSGTKYRDYSYCNGLLEEFIEKVSYRPWTDISECISHGVMVIGDLHGSYSNLSIILEVFEREQPGKLVFLGDYADRGRESLEVLCRLIELKLGEPEKIVLLRGNHESKSMNTYYGFLEELYSKFGMEKGFKLFQKFLRVYTRLSWLALSGNLLLIHGGIPCKVCSPVNGVPASLDELIHATEAVKDTYETTEGIPSILIQAVWNDPDGGIKWFAPNIRGEGIYVYGRLAWKTFLQNSKLKGIIRSHEVKDAYAMWLANGKYYEGNALESYATNNLLKLDSLEYPVLTVFSSNYH